MILEMVHFNIFLFIMGTTYFFITDLKHSNRSGIRRRQQNILSIRCQYIYANVFLFFFSLDQLKNQYLEKNYRKLTKEEVFNLWGVTFPICLLCLDPCTQEKGGALKEAIVHSNVKEGVLFFVLLVQELSSVWVISHQDDLQEFVLVFAISLGSFLPNGNTKSAVTTCQ